MRTLFAAAVSLLALTSANAQPATTTPERSTTLGSIQTEHPEWFTERDMYRPCPASVVFPGERHACLGLPEYPHRTTITVYWHPRHWWRRGYFN
jgi:hypothetical protein